MRSLISIILIVAGIILLHIFLSFSKNKYMGLVLPGFILLCAITVSMQCTDFFTAFLFLVLLSIPAILTLGIHKACRRKIEKRKADELKRMKIGDL